MQHRIPFSGRPGRHERHFCRKLNNPLFPAPITGFGDEELLEVQRLDHEELVRFIADLKALVAKAVQLPPNAASEQVLSLKEQLDQAYEISAGLADDQHDNQAAIRQLTEVIMQAVARSAAGDAMALAQLEQERTARAEHYRLLRQPIVADLLQPDSLITAAELAPCLLSEDEAGLDAALTLFDRQQLADILIQARGLALSAPERELSRGLWQMERRLTEMTQTQVI